jgi:hypothetical protein
LLQVTEEAHNLGIRLDLPAYNDLVKALVEADQSESAAIILQEIASCEAVSPNEDTYLPLIEDFIAQREFSQAIE